MRTLIGIIIGAALTVGVAYVHDTHYATAAPETGGVPRTIVNWDVANEVASGTIDSARREFENLLPR